MAGKRGRAKKTEPVAVEAADSTSIEDQSQQNGDSNEVIEPVKAAAPGKKGGRGRKVEKVVEDIVEKVVEDKPEKVAVKKSGRGKKEVANGDMEKPKEETETTNKRGRSKREQNDIVQNVTETKEEKIVEDIEEEEEEEEEDKKKKGGSSPPSKKPGRKRAAETETKVKDVSPEKEIKSSRGRKKKEVEKPIESDPESEVAPPIVIPAEKPTKGGRGKKRSKAEEITNEAVEDLNAEEKPEEPVTKKEKKSKTTAKITIVKSTSEKTTKTKALVEKKPKQNATDTHYDPKDFEFDKEYTIKISSWNVAGLRSWVSKGCLEYIQFEKPDIFCLQETKCSEDMIPEEARVQGYHPYWYCKPGGYAGVAIYSKKMPINVEYGIGDEEQDEDARLLTAEYEKFYLVNVYVPNAGRKLVTLPKRMRWDNLFHDYIVKLNKKKPVIICGDMNVSHQEIDLANPKTNKKNAGFTQEERDGMTKLLSMGFVDTFRYLYPDTNKAYTFWTYMMNARAKNVGWRLDYFIVSEKLLKKVVENVIRSKVKGSDHCPITLFLNC